LADTVRELRRQQIVRAARAIVASEGLDALTIGALETRLSFSRGVITYHFANKDEIVDAVLASAIAEIDAATRAEVDAQSRPEEKLRAVLHATVHGFLEHPEAVRILVSFWGRIGAQPAIRAANAKLYSTYRRRAAGLVRDGIARKAFTPERVDAVAALLVAIVIGIATQVYFEPGAIDADATVVAAQSAVLAGLGARDRAAVRKLGSRR
jgi:AcrR family transcriptional regulator